MESLRVVILSEALTFFLFLGHTDSVSCTAFSSDGQLVGSGGFDGTVKVWDVSSNTLKWTLEGPSGGIEVKI